MDSSGRVATMVVFYHPPLSYLHPTLCIPMGTDCAPLLANLFLFYYEYNYMKNLIKTNLIVAKNFNYTTRYIDDLLTLNNGRLKHAVHEIYPTELEIKITTECRTSFSYLDILITIDNGNYTTAVFDKRANLTLLTSHT